MARANHLNSKTKAAGRNVLAEMPKIEVHRHLEGTYPVEHLFRMAMKNELDVPKNIDDFRKEFQFPRDHKPDFLLFLSKFKKFWYKDLEDVYSITYESVKSFEEDRLHYIELRFNPLHFTELTGLDPKKVTEKIIAAGDDAAGEIDLNIRYLLTFNRGVQTSDEMIAVYESLHETDLSRVVGIDLAGDETNYPPELFTGFFDRVKKDGQFGIDIHAGEIGDSKNIWVSIDQLHADRIGHGVASINDAEIQQVLKDKNIFLAQCITSNYQTGAWEDETTHPMKELTASGVPITIASDDPMIQSSTLTDDYEKAVKYFGWDIEDLIRLNLASIEGCFLTDREKAALTKSYSTAVKNFRRKIAG